MLSIDEAIAREKYLAEIYRSEIAPKEDYHNMPWIDMENESNMRRAKEHEQLAEWLEELKALREQTTWIPCSEKLPELRKDVLVTVRYTGFMGMYGYWTRTGHMEAKNDWWGDCAGGEVIAWMPLPQPYKVEGE